ncbi:MAG: hypothetical protein Q9195_001193 [Heterodermia aff. obscurata]
MAATYAPVNTVAWYNDPEFVAARNRTIPPGGANSYGKTLYSCSLSSTTKKINGITDETPPIGSVPWDKTDFIFGVSADTITRPGNVVDSSYAQRE